MHAIAASSTESAGNSKMHVHGANWISGLIFVLTFLLSTCLTSGGVSKAIQKFLADRISECEKNQGNHTAIEVYIIQGRRRRCDK